MKKILNKRLEMVSAFIHDNENVIDVGCDHGLLGIYLILNRKNIRVISSDIKEGPILKAKENILKYHLEDKIELKLGNGLEPITDDITTVVISGMGGINMVNILKSINNYPKVKKLVLSPNNDFEFLRKNISKIGYMINNEKMIDEKGKYYLIIEAIKGKKRVRSFFGKLNLRDKVVKQYYKDLYNQNKKILNNLSLFNKIKKIKMIYQNLLIRVLIKNK